MCSNSISGYFLFALLDFLTEHLKTGGSLNLKGKNRMLQTTNPNAEISFNEHVLLIDI